MRIIVPTGFQARAVGREGTLVVRLCMNRLARNIVVGPKKSRFDQTRCVSLIFQLAHKMLRVRHSNNTYMR